jgi:hypothetical protein
MARRHQRTNDRDGTTVRPGDRVRVLGIPDLSGMPPPYRQETERVFRHILGSVKRVESIDAQSNAILMFRIRSGHAAGYHSVAIEGIHLRKVRT